MTKTPKDINKYRENDELGKEDLWDECLLAFNSALQRANNLFPNRWEIINQAKEQIKVLIQKSEVTEECVDEECECNEWKKLMDETRRIG